ncbi:MAG: hypothetical protein M0D57_21550 [Sphingobacteriales bacterium JAD_PAG50586_3]|nr:MAG: hypothetical protein M0D57_21550 [Sphingobacteriales bacterium JAD_PAG50586_3]
MKIKNYIALCALALLTLAACEKDKPLEETPYIEITSVTPTSAQAYSDTITFTVLYRDGNGDLGENNPDVYNLFLKDGRNQVEYKYRIQQLAPDNGSAVPIQGNLLVKLAGAPIINGGSSETVTYTMYVEDRAGNKSNVATSPTITLNQ